MSNSTIHDIARVLPIIEFLLAAQHSSQELRLRGRLGDAPHTEVLHAERRRTIAMLRAFSLHQEDDHWNDLDTRPSVRDN